MSPRNHLCRARYVLVLAVVLSRLYSVSQSPQQVASQHADAALLDGRPGSSGTIGRRGTGSTNGAALVDALSLSMYVEHVWLSPLLLPQRRGRSPSYVGDKTPILHATAPNLMRARLKMQHGLPLESTMLNSAVDELQELAQEAAYAKRHMEMSARHAVQEFYKAKAKLKHCKQEIRAYIYEVDEAV